MHRWMTSQFFLFFFTWVTFVSYWALIFDDRGFSAEAIGLSITVSLITRSLSVALLFPLANRSVSIGTIARLLPGASAVLGICLLPHTGLTGLLLLSGAFGLLYPTLMPVLETTASLGAQHGSLDYGRARMWGSAGFIAGAIVNGALQQLLGTEVLLPLFLLGLLALAGASLLPIGDEEVARQRSEGMGSWAPVFTHRIVVLALMAAVVVQSSHAAFYAYGALHLNRLGAAPWLLAVFLIVSPLAEMVAFRATAGWGDRAPIWVLMALAVGASALRWVLWMLPLPVPALVASNVLHGLTYGMMQVGFIQVLRRHLPAALIAPAQSVYAALGMGVGTAVMTAIAGSVFDASAQLAFAWMLGCALLAIPLVLLLRRGERNRLPAEA